MSKPVWSQPSNTSLGTFVERQRLGVGSVPNIQLPVSDPENVANIETQQFLDNVETYATLNDIYIKSNGLARTPWLGAPIGYDRYAPTAQSYVFQFPALRSDVPLTQPDNPIAALGNVGVAIDGVPFRSTNSGNTTILGGKVYTDNSAAYPVRKFFMDGSGVIGTDGAFYYQTSPTKLIQSAEIAHSRIIGFAFDGLPIYGPYGYINPDANLGGVKIMTSSYQLKKQHRANGTIPDGTFIEDFEYVAGSGDLDEHNSRFCITPEYPGGIQAYFVTVDPDRPLFPKYPYIIGPTYWGAPTLPNGDMDWPGKISVSVISGKLPPGLRIEGLTITGTPFAVINTTTSRFVLRATNLSGVSDRTFIITISLLTTAITWQTASGPLPVGNNQHYYVLDNSLINFQLDAIDNVLPSGKYIDYHIPPNGGELPGGIKLSSAGLLYGFTAPLLSVETGGDTGKYDTTLYDKFGYDYGVRPMNGYDSFYFDNQLFDYSNPNRAPKKLNRYYQFTVRASDGVRYVDRRFQIYVVGDDYLRADNDIMRIGTNTFSADNTYMRKTIWITPNYLGRLRASNYITIIMDIFDPSTLEGTIGFILNNSNRETIATNASWGASPGTVTSVTITLDPANVIGTINVGDYVDAKGFPMGTHVLDWNPSTKQLIVGGFSTSNIPVSNGQTLTIGTQSQLPPGMVLDELSGNIYGSVPYQPAITKTYRFTINALRYSVDPSVPNVPSYRTFTVDIMGNVDSVIHFTTDGNLGTIDANFISDLSVKAVTTVPNAVLVYNLVSGRIPPGLVLVNDGTIQGKVNQFGSSGKPGLITFDNNTTILDAFTTTLDRSYTFTVEARDQFNESATTKTFRLNINTPNNKLYSNIYIKPLLSTGIRTSLRRLLNDTGIFPPSSVYRSSDPQFGVQNEFKMLLYPGIETKMISAYVSAFGRTSKKRFRIGSLKKAIAKEPGTNIVVYELVYLEILDNQENANGSVAEYIGTGSLKHRVGVNQGRRDTIDSDPFDNDLAAMTIDSLSRVLIQDKVMSADFGGQLAGNQNRSSVFGNSVTNIRNNIASIGDTERNYLPLWMRTPQTASGIQQGFTKAVPICYCIPGTADNIILNIENSGFDFKMINYTIDRAIIDSVVGDVGDKYIAFAAREVING